MVIDTEWGGFGDRSEAEYIFTQYDKIIDSRSEHPGVNTYAYIFYFTFLFLLFCMFSAENAKMGSMPIRPHVSSLQ